MKRVYKKIINKIMKCFSNIDITNTKSKYFIKTETDVFWVYKKIIPYVFKKHVGFTDLNEAIKYINK